MLERIERALGRSRAQEMALDVHETDAELRRLPDQELAERAGRLEELLASYPAEAREAERHTAELERRAEELRADEQRLAQARERRDELGRLERARRAALDEQIARQRQLVDRGRERHTELARAAAAGQAAGEQWLECHGVELAQATTIERELASRRAELYEQAIVRAAHEPADDLIELLGERPDSLLERDQWDQAAAAAEGYRARYGELPDPHAPGEGPHRSAWQQARHAAAQLDDLPRGERHPAAGLEPPEPHLPEPDIDLGP